MATTPRTLILRMVFSLMLIVVVTGIGTRWMLRHGITPPLHDLFPSGEIVVAVDASYPPFAVATEDDLFGLDIDVSREIGRRIGLPVRFINMGYDGLYDSLKTGQTDIIVSALLMDGLRLGDVRYTRFYFDAGLILVSDNGINRMADLPARSLAFEFGSSADTEVRMWARRIGEFERLPYELPVYALDAVRSGQADAALVDAITGRLYLREHPEWKPTYRYIDHAPFAVAVRIDRKFVLKLVNQALQDMVDDGTLSEIVSRWL